MKTHSNVLAWEISWTEDPGRLQFMGPQRVSTTECAHTWVSFCFKRMHSAPCVQGQLCSDNDRLSGYAPFMQEVASRHGALCPARHVGLVSCMELGMTLWDSNGVELRSFCVVNSVVFTLGLQTSVTEESVGGFYGGRRVTKFFHERSYCLKKNRRIFITS